MLTYSGSVNATLARAVKLPRHYPIVQRNDTATGRLADTLLHVGRGQRLVHSSRSTSRRQAVHDRTQ